MESRGKLGNEVGKQLHLEDEYVKSIPSGIPLLEASGRLVVTSVRMADAHIHVAG